MRAALWVACTFALQARVRQRGELSLPHHTTTTPPPNTHNNTNTIERFENYFGRRIAVDASMHIYQFLIVVGRQGDQLLTTEAGEVTSHLQGMFYRTVRLLEAGERWDDDDESAGR